nr:SWIM zinc finger family protein [Listeria aquatica]
MFFEDGERVEKYGEHLFDCTCSAHKYGERVCKHIYAAFLKDEEFKHEIKKTKPESSNSGARIGNTAFAF